MVVLNKAVQRAWRCVSS